MSAHASAQSAIAEAWAALFRVRRFACTCRPRELRAERGGLQCANCDRPLVPEPGEREGAT